VRPTAALAGFAAMLAGASAVALLAQRSDAFPASRDDPSIQYSTRPLADRISGFNRELRDGAVHLAFDRRSGYLSSLLAALRVPVASQALVFSQGSLQAALISPRTPRAVFFNDSVAIGWVPGGGVVEIADQDPRQGVIFYTLDQKVAATPQLKRDDSCLSCHLSWDTLAVPGLLALSTFPMSDDKNAYATGLVADHRTPLEQRWGGWYVTGKAVPTWHMGNVPVIQTPSQLSKPPARPPQLQSAQGRFDTLAYPSVYSDVAALMVLDHQTHMTNLLTRLGWEARLAQQKSASNPAGNRVGSAGRTSATDRISDSARDLVDYMLFVDEAPIASKIEGSSGFAEKFSAEGPRDSKGRSLRQLDLEHRLMRYPCSYMIYTEAFDALPPGARDAVYTRMWQILSGQDTDKPYTRLSVADRRAIVEILRETKKTLPAYFQPVTH
jgi:hypothetical protein